MNYSMHFLSLIHYSEISDIITILFLSSVIVVYQISSFANISPLTWAHISRNIQYNKILIQQYNANICQDKVNGLVSSENNLQSRNLLCEQQ